MKQLFSEFYNMILMLISAFIGVFIAIMFKGGYGWLYKDDKLQTSKLVWLFLIQFFASIAVFMTSFAVSNLFFFPGKLEISLLLAFILALAPVEITIAFLITTISRIYVISLKKIDPNFDEEKSLKNLKDFLEFSGNIEKSLDKKENDKKET